jgi:anti-anti-sigma regulatory factor
MELRTLDISTGTLIQVGGRIDHTTAKDFENRLLPRLAGCADETKKILLDLAK